MSQSDNPSSRNTAGTSWRETARLLSTLRGKRPPSVRPATALAVLVGVAVLGTLAAPGEIAPATHGGVTHWGGWVLESAFNGCVLVAAFTTFRVLEVLYRTHDAAALRMLPLAGGAVGLDRLRTCVFEALAGNALVLAFVAPAAFRPGGLAPFLCTALFGIVATLVVPLVGFAVVVGAGVATVASSPDARRGASTDAAAHFAPGAAFGAASALLLLAKLGAEDPLRSAGAALTGTGAVEITRATMFGLGVPLVVAIGLGLYALRAYATSHDALQARFLDAESHRIDTGYAYFQEGPQPLSKVERWLGDAGALLYRKDRLQLARSTPFLRVGTWLIAAIALFVGWAGRDSLSGTGLGLALGAWLAVVVSPYRRLLQLHGEERFGFADMLAPAQTRQSARVLATASELGRHATPLLLVGIGMGVQSALQIAAYVVVTGAALSLAAASRHPESERTRLAWSAIATGVTAAAFSFALWAGLAVAVASAAAALAFIARSTTSPTAPVHS